MAKDFQLSSSFSFNELTLTSHTDLLASQRLEAKSEPVLGKLYVLANTVLEPVRQQWNSPITVNSGYRSLAVNTRIRGSKTSQHMLGEAADITVGSPSLNKKLWELFIKMSVEGHLRFGQLILEPTWIHVSLPRPYRPSDGQVMTFDGKKYTLITTHKYSGV